jgi:hypothetical protein
MSPTSYDLIRALLVSIAEEADAINIEAGTAASNFSKSDFDCDPALVAKGGIEIIIEKAETLLLRARMIQRLK